MKKSTLARINAQRYQQEARRSKRREENAVSGARTSWRDTKS